jgi:dTDP-L-rhamnose 4-epimerase
VTKKILVTGGAGFIGSHLVDELVKRGHDVQVVDNLEPQVHKHKPDYLNPKAKYHTKDILEAGVLPALLRDAEVVFHLAAMVGVGQSMYQVTRYVDANVGGTARLLQVLADGKHSVKKLVVASSMSIYGEGAYECPTHGSVAPPLRPPEQYTKKDWEIHCPTCGKITRPVPTPETKPLNTNSVYAVTKRDQEELCLAVGRAYTLPTVALRFFNAYGPRQSLDNPYTGVCAIFQSRIKNNQPPVVFEDGKQTRDFVSVHDIVQGCVRAMETNGADYEPVNLGSGKPITILDVANVLLRLYRSPLAPRVENKFRAGDVRHCSADLTKARKLLGFEPKVPFEDGMQELVAWGQGVQATDHFKEAYEELRSKGLVEG